MALVIADRVRETSTSTGTSTFVLAGAVVGYQSFFSAIGNANTTYYTISNQGTSEWEVGIGTVSTGSLTRTTVLASSNANALVNFTAGTKDVFVTYPAEKAVYLDASGNVSLSGTFSGTISGTGAFTTLSASSTVSGTGFSNYLASPPAIGGTAAAAGTFTTLGCTVLTASADSSFTSTGAVLLSKGTTAQRPTGAAGKLRFNTDTSQFEGYNGSAWASVGGAAISNDTTTATARYPLFSDATTGTALTVYTSNANYLYTPSTGQLDAPEHNSSNGITVNNATVNTSYSIPSGANALSAGPMSVASGIVVTVPSGSTWVIS